MNICRIANANLIIILSILFTCFSFGQSAGQFEYVNPLPGSGYASPETNIIMRPGSIIDKESISSDLISGKL